MSVSLRYWVRCYMLNSKFPSRSILAWPVLFLSWSRAIKPWFPITVFIYWFSELFIFFFSASTQSMKSINSSIPNLWGRERRIRTTSLRWGLKWLANFDIYIKLAVIRFNNSTPWINSVKDKIQQAGEGEGPNSEYRPVNEKKRSSFCYFPR